LAEFGRLFGWRVRLVVSGWLGQCGRLIEFG
jgi:hypothetical protein